MILILEILSIWLALALLVAAVVGPALKRKFGDHETAPSKD